MSRITSSRFAATCESNPPRAPVMPSNCLTHTLERLHTQGGKMVAAGSVRGPLMHVWHESKDDDACRYEPDRRLRHWAGALFGYPGHVTHTRPAARA